MIRHNAVYLLIGKLKILQRISTHQALKQVYTNGKNLATKLAIGAPLTSLAIMGFKKSSNSGSTITTKEVLLAKADALFEQGEYQKIYDLLQNYRDSNDDEILWRLSKALYNMAKVVTDAEARKMIYEGYDLILKALEIKEDNFAVHKWMAVLLDAKSGYEGKKARIQELHNVKKHLLRATELNPKDATSIYMLGNWCYQISDLAWYQRKIAAAIFGEPPDSSFEEALKYFEKAEQVTPNFYSYNHLFLGKTYLKLNRKEDALKYLKKAAEYPAKTDDDLQAKQEATKLLGNI